jgi:hypothetical protein
MSAAFPLLIFAFYARGARTDMDGPARASQATRFEKPKTWAAARVDAYN